MGQAKSFLPVAAAFLACIFANIKTLQFANVESECAAATMPS